MITPFIATTILLQPQSIITSRKLRDGKPTEKVSSVIINERFLQNDRFSLVTHSVYPSGSTSYGISSFDFHGNPLETSQEGFWNDRWNVFTSKFGAKSVRQTINDEVNIDQSPRSKFRNPTVLWFWKTKPKVGCTETVKFLAQNTIATFEIKFTYEGNEVLEIMGKKVKAHRVREIPLSAPKAVYTIWWYDDEGMGIKRYHKTTTSEFTFGLVSWK